MLQTPSRVSTVCAFSCSSFGEKINCSIFNKLLSLGSKDFWEILGNKYNKLRPRLRETENIFTGHCALVLVNEKFTLMFSESYSIRMLADSESVRLWSHLYVFANLAGQGGYYISLGVVSAPQSLSADVYRRPVFINMAANKEMILLEEGVVEACSRTHVT
ncbi:hypothetical protein J6590_025417 [Homalodisca vitripennis]|nr:hypothetical protein J6590_025417 [Homalodisca vitripennis]